MKVCTRFVAAGALFVGCVSSISCASADPASITVDDRTSCLTAIGAFDEQYRPAMLPIVNYIENMMYNLDQRHTDNGEPGIMSQLSDKGELDMAILAVEHCRLHPNSTIYNAAAFVYVGMRDLEIQFGTAK